MKKLMKRSIALLMMLVMIMAAASVAVSAKTVSKTVKKQKFTTSTNAIEKKAVKVKKGTTKLNIKKGQGYVRFVAPKTKTYTFTFSKCTSSMRSSNGYVTFMRKDASSPQYSYSFNTKLKTKGGKDNTLWLSVNGADFSSNSNLLSRPIASRTGKIKLKKGESIYMYVYFGGRPAKAKLVIK